MQKKIKRTITVEVSICNICREEVTVQPHNKKRIEIVQHLFNTEDFDGHQGCINEVIKEAFKEYI